MEQLQVRQATTQDLTIVQRIGRETFSETFAESNLFAPS